MVPVEPHKTEDTDEILSPSKLKLSLQSPSPPTSPKETACGAPRTGRPPFSRSASAMKLVGEMCEAAWKADAKELTRLIELNACPQMGDYDSRTPLHLAACAGSLECVKLLVEKGAELTQDRFGCLAIHDAVRHGHTDVATYLKGLEVQREVTQDVQKQRVFGKIIKEGIFSLATVQSELACFFDLGLHPSYFDCFSLDETAHLIHCLVAAKCAAQITATNRLHFEICGEAGITYIATSDNSREAELHISKYVETTWAASKLSSLVFYVSENPAMPGGKPLAVFRANATDNEFDPVSPCSSRQSVSAVTNVFPEALLRTLSTDKLAIYKRLMDMVFDYKSAVVEQLPPDAEEPGMTSVYMGLYNPGRNSGVKELFQIFRSFGVLPLRLRRESFSNEIAIVEMTFSNKDAKGLKKVVPALGSVPFLSCMDETAHAIADLAMSSTISFEQAQWMVAVGKFCFHFYPKDTPEYRALCRRFRDDPAGQSALDDLYLKTISELIQEDKIYEVLLQYLPITQKAYQDFHDISRGIKQPFFNEDLANEIRSTVADQTARVILLDCVLKFNRYLRITNFFKTSNTKSDNSGTSIVPMAMAYRFDGSFLNTANKNLYPEAPFAIILVVGRGFYGFHSRFRDVARGGIRIIRSRNAQVYKTNAARLYEEAYNLAFTQQKKNKDIPEAGSKGTILLAQSHQSEDASMFCFLSYIDALLDCMLCHTCGIHSWLPSQELLFFGPDENTAGFMDLGAKRARQRGYPFWKALTTGKSTRLGGIPHDTYGMTTNSVHEYVVQMLEQLGLREEDCTKVQTGGPDGDLGSNEILISKDKTIGIVDGSGVIYDPKGLDRPELVRLAEERVPVSEFDSSKLGADGFKVLIGDMNITLPDGTKFTSGVELRDTFHLSKYASSDLFVPCGGRPNAVNVGNVKQLFREDGSAKFKYIVEGANLFFTSDARKILEDKGVKLFKDASTNKGGVTSSSLEVFSSLAMDEKDHQLNMCVEPGNDPPEFYANYVQDIVNIIRHNASCEFKILWQEMRKGHSSMEITDRLSAKINFLTDTMFKDLNEVTDKVIIEKVLRACIPKSLLEHVGFENIWNRTPRNYLMAMVATNLASKYVYQNGLDASEFVFYTYLKNITEA